MAGFRKRTVAMKRSGNAKSYPIKKKFIRKRRSRTTSFTSKASTANSFGFRSKKIKPNTYRNILWKDSIMKTKYRTCQAFTQGQTSAADSARYTIGLYDAFGTTASPFWTAAGGTVNTDFGSAVPTFNGDIIVRGGILGIRITNQDTDSQPQEVRVMLFRTIDRQGAVPPAITNQPIGFDMTILTDFTQFYGRPLMQKTVLLENNNVAEFKFRLRVHKVDQYQFSQVVKRYYWMVALNSCTNATATSATVTQYWNASFAADAV